MKKTNEFDNLINKMNKQDAIPDHVFRYQLKQQVLNKFEKKGVISTLSEKLSVFRYFALTSASLAAFVMIVFIITNTLNLQTSVQELGNTSVNLDDENKEALLNNIYSQNPNQITNIGVNTAIYTVSDIAEFEQEATTANASLYQAKFLRQDYYIGNLDQCNLSDKIQLPKNSETNFALNIKSGKYYITSKTVDEENKLLSYIYQDSENVIEYMGGEYAVSYSTDNSKKQSSSLLTSAKFDEDSQIKEIDDIEKKIYIITTSEKQFDCNIISVTKVDGSSYKIQEVKNYVDEITEDNLLYTIKYSYKDTFNLWNDISEKFTTPQELVVINKSSITSDIKLIAFDQLITITDYNFNENSYRLNTNFHPTSSFPALNSLGSKESAFVSYTTTSTQEDSVEIIATRPASSILDYLDKISSTKQDDLIDIYILTDKYIKQY